jgi:hypothetical protein
MASSSSSVGSNIPFPESSDDSREMTPEYNPVAAAEAVAPPHWDAEEFDFFWTAWSESEQELTDDVSLDILVQSAILSSHSSDYSWEGDEDEDEITSPAADETNDGSSKDLRCS